MIGKIINKEIKKNHIPRDKGSTVIEVTAVMPLVLFIVVMFIMSFIRIIERETARSDIYSAIYSVSDSEEIKGEEISEGVNEALYLGTADMTESFLSGGRVLVACRINTDNYEDNILCIGEKDVCTERLRRWQLYDDIRENYGP